MKTEYSHKTRKSRKRRLTRFVETNKPQQRGALKNESTGQANRCIVSYKRYASLRLTAVYSPSWIWMLDYLSNPTNLTI
jgi:hypothetical protein